MFKSVKQIAALLCTAGVSLSGCSIMPSIDDLMRAPKLSEEQAAVNEALILALGTDNFKLKYPRSGDYRSAYVFYDIDTDGINEAIVFYQQDLGGTRIGILDYENGGWAAVYNTAIDKGREPDYREIDSISFENIESLDYKNIIIGWQPDSTTEKVMSIYAYENRRLVERFDSPSELRYQDEIIRDFNADGLMDIVLVSADTRNIIKLVSSKNGKIQMQDEKELSDQITNLFGQPVYGKLPDGRNAIFIDVQLRKLNSSFRSGFATEIVTVENGSLIPQIDIASVYVKENQEEETEDIGQQTGQAETPLEEITPEQQKIRNFRATQRYEKISSTDVNNDGLIEVPSSSLLPGYEDLGADVSLYESKFLTTYSTLQSGVMQPVLRACVNVDAGYLVKMPDNWLNQVTVVSDNNINQWQFIKYGEGLADRSIELLRIIKVSKNDYQDRNDKSRILLGESGLDQYYGYLYTPPAEDAALQITKEQLLNMFVLLR